MRFKDFIQTENQFTKTLGSDGTDPNPVQTVKSAERLASGIADDSHYADDFAKLSMMSPGVNRRKGIMDLAGDAVQNNPTGSSRANPLDVSKFLTTQFNQLGPPGSDAGKFKAFARKFMKKMKKGMKK